MRPILQSRAAGPLAAFLLLLTVGGCAVNPATGERQLSFVSEEEEIRMGREADQQIVQTMGLYPDSSLQSYVSDLGRDLAARSERPGLPWTFRVLDDPIVNAFALPGGYIYITRGIMAHMGSEAELVGVLGHEIGHVTARHSVNQMSRAQLAQLGLGLGMIFVPEARPFGDLAGASLQLLFLKFGRDDERQADDLGIRYMTRLDYDPRELASVMRTLGRTSEAAGGDRIPGWLSTHPDPENREERIRETAATLEMDLSGAIVRREPYLRRIDGMVFGANPREGYFEEGVFYHPDLRFRIDFPSGWATANQKSAVQAVSPDQDAALLLTLEDGQSARSAAADFLSQEGIGSVRSWSEPVHGLPASWVEFRAQSGDTELRGLALFVEHGGSIFRFLGYAPRTAWSSRAGAVQGALESFQELTDAQRLAVQPDRLQIFELPSGMSFQRFVTEYPGPASEQTLAIINQVEQGEELPGGRLVKRIVGGG